MSFKQTYHLMTAVMVGLFLFFQVGSLTHTSQLDLDEPHQHCAVCLVVTEDLDPDPVILTSSGSALSKNDCFEEPATIQPETFYALSLGRAPPPRGPPTFLT